MSVPSFILARRKGGENSGEISDVVWFENTGWH